MTATQGAQRGESAADAALLPRGEQDSRPAGADVLATDELEGCEIGEYRGTRDANGGVLLSVEADVCGRACPRLAAEGDLG